MRTATTFMIVWAVLNLLTIGAIGVRAIYVGCRAASVQTAYCQRATAMLPAARPALVPAGATTPATAHRARTQRRTGE